MTLVTSLFTVVQGLVLFGLAGGGGSSSGGGGGGGGYSGGSSSYSGGWSSSGDSSGSPVASLIVFGIITVIGLSFTFVVNKRNPNPNQNVRNRKLKKRLAAAANTDSVWSEDALIAHVKQAYVQYQVDWSHFNVAAMEAYMTPAYLRHTQLMMAALKLAHRQNKVEHLDIKSVDIVKFTDMVDNATDSFVAKISITARDILVDTNSEEILYDNKVDAIEYYRFNRADSAWLLDGINQATASAASRQAQLQQFSQQNNLNYSLDWGSLLLPRRGQLFNDGSFEHSDINNHTIGEYKDVIVQIYTYSPDPRKKSKKDYVVAQMALPRTYGNIVVRQNSGLHETFSGKTKGLTRIETEWSAFNKRYAIYATDAEQATSLELLHPAYMEKLEAVGFDVNLEVVDSTVYLYSDSSNTQYSEMLELLKSAYEEMKL